MKRTGGYFDQLTSPAACEQELLTMSLTISPPVQAGCLVSIPDKTGRLSVNLSS